MKNKKVTFFRKKVSCFPCGKRGWIRILEAVIGIMIILGILALVYSRSSQGEDVSGEIYNMQKNVLEQIASDAELRNSILSDSEEVAEGKIVSFIESGGLVLPVFDFGVRICDLGVLNCNLPVNTGGSVYVEERVISSSLEEFNPKKVRLFVWRK